MFPVVASLYPKSKIRRSLRRGAWVLIPSIQLLNQSPERKLKTKSYYLDLALARSSFPAKVDSNLKNLHITGTASRFTKSNLKRKTGLLTQFLDKLNKFLVFAEWKNRTFDWSDCRRQRQPLNKTNKTNKTF